MGYAFISYSTKNQSSADSMRELFNKHNIDTWMAPYDIPAGSKYAAVITKAIRDCSCFVLLLSNDAQSSEAVDSEVELATLTFKKSMITVELEKVILNDAFTFYIHNKQIIAVHQIDENSYEIKQILEAVKVYTREGSEAFEEQDISTHSPLHPKNENTLILDDFDEHKAWTNKTNGEDSANNGIIKKLAEIPVSEGWKGYLFIDKAIDSALMIVDDMFHITKRGTVVVGRILRGRISIGDTLEIVGLTYEKETVTVTGIEMHRKLLDFAEAGDNVGVLIRTENPARKKLFSKEYKIAVERGQVLASPNSIHAYSVFECQIRGELFANHSNQLQISSKLQFDFGSTDITGFVENICDEGDLNMSIVVRLICPFALETGYGFRILNEKRECITTGIITRLIK